MQVAISVVASLHVDARKPISGAASACPTTCRTDFVLDISRPYLGDFLSVPSDWTPLKHYANVFHGFNQPQLDPTDPWQFTNFLITDGD